MGVVSFLVLTAFSAWHLKCHSERLTIDVWIGYIIATVLFHCLKLFNLFFWISSSFNFMKFINILSATNSNVKLLFNMKPVPYMHKRYFFKHIIHILYIYNAGMYIWFVADRVRWVLHCIYFFCYGFMSQCILISPVKVFTVDLNSLVAVFTKLVYIWIQLRL